MKRLWRAYGAQFIRFGLVGIVNTLIDYGVYALWIHFFGDLFEESYLVGQVLGFTCGTLNAYFMNGRFVFSGDEDKKQKHAAGQVQGFTCSKVNACSMNGKLVFASGKDKHQKKHVGRLVRCFTGYGATCLLAAFLLWVWVSRVGIDEHIAKLINLCVTVPLNFVINKFWTYA